MFEVFIIRLHGRALSERLMRPAGVAEVLEFGRLDAQGADAELAGVELVELVAAGGVGALHAAVILGAFGRCTGSIHMSHLAPRRGAAIDFRNGGAHALEWMRRTRGRHALQRP